MKYQPAIYTLERLHAELGGKIKDSRRAARRLAGVMKHVEAVLKMHDPKFNLQTIAPRRRYKAAAPYRRGEVFRTIMSIMLLVDRPLTSREISETLLKRAGIRSRRQSKSATWWGRTHVLAEPPAQKGRARR